MASRRFGVRSVHGVHGHHLQAQPVLVEADTAS